MFNLGLKSNLGRIATRNVRTFRVSAVSLNEVYGTPKEGPYSNLPFKVHGRKIPFGVYYWGILGFFFAFPFLSAYWQLKKSGSLQG